MKLSQIFTAPNQLTLLRMIFVPFIVIHLVDGRYLWALVVFVIAGFSDGLDGWKWFRTLVKVPSARR